jgi:hypothetical protein
LKQFHLISVAPGPYEITASAKGFATHKVSIRLLTEQTMNVPMILGISSQSQTVEVTDKPPVLDTADSRTQLTIGEEALDALPLPGRNLLGLEAISPMKLENKQLHNGRSCSKTEAWPI